MSSYCPACGQIGMANITHVCPPPSGGHPVLVPVQCVVCPSCGGWYFGTHECPMLHDLSPLGGGPRP